MVNVALLSVLLTNTTVVAQSEILDAYHNDLGYMHVETMEFSADVDPAVMLAPGDDATLIKDTTNAYYLCLTDAAQGILLCYPATYYSFKI